MPRRVLGALVLGLLSGNPAVAQADHTVNLVREAAERFRFDPQLITARPGETLDFVVQSGGPYVVAFAGDSLAPDVRAELDAALVPGRTGSLRGPVLTGPGARFQFRVPALPEGTYRFFAVTHIAYRMEGRLVVR